MGSGLGRWYASAAALLLFFVAWAAVAARPWAQPATDPRLAQLDVRATALRREGVLVQTIVRQRWATYRVRLATRKHEIAVAQARQRRLAAAAAAPPPVAAAGAASVRVVTLPPLTITRTS